MKKNLFILFFSVIASALFAGGIPYEDQYNFVSFTSRKQNRDAWVDSLTPAALQKHPEYGILPYHPPCEDCMELLDHRDATNRYFIDKKSHGKMFYKQQSYGAINYKDSSGFWKEINYRLQPGTAGIFEARNQSSPVVINLPGKYSSITCMGNEFRFNKNPELFEQDQSGSVTSLGTPDWSHYSAGDDGVLIKDFYPGIDLEMIVMEGKLKTNFIIRNRLQLRGNWLVMKQEMMLPPGLAFNPDETNKDDFGKLLGEIAVTDQSNEYFRIYPCVAFDGAEQRHTIRAGSEIQKDQLLTYIPVSWLNDPGTIYPVVIDPMVATSGNLGQASITGSQYNATCWTSGCSYPLFFNTPANCTITDIKFDFQYLAQGLCMWPDGGVSIDYGSCRSPAAGVHSCNVAGSGICTLSNVSMFFDFLPCLSTPQCLPYIMNFNMNFYRCNNDATAGCNSACIAAASAWSVIIMGQTVQIASLSPNQQICEGDSANLVVTSQYGVAPFTYSWTPSGSNNDTIFVSPAVTTDYQIRVTDACGQATIDTATVFVIPNNNPGFTISPNPACAGQNVSITGLGAGAAANYDWQIPGSGNPVVNDTPLTVVQYPLQGTFPVTLNYASGACLFSSQQNVTINNFVNPSVALSAAPAGAACAGTSVLFTAVPVNGGTSPSYQWQVNGVNAGTNSDTFSVILNTPSVVSVVMTSNLQCLSAATANAQVIVPVNASVTPTVSITSNTTAPFCSGNTIVFTANPVSGGTTPSYQWQINGMNIGTNSDTFSVSTLVNGDIVKVIMTSNSGCATTAIVSDTVLANVISSAIPSVSIQVFPNDTICSGTNTQFTPVPVNGGSPPSYTWYVNGIASGNGNSFSSSSLNTMDSVSVTMVSAFSCASPASASSWSVISVIPNATPSVSLIINPSDSICAGTPILSTAIPVHGGSVPLYQWFVNGTPIAGAFSDTISFSSLTNGDVIQVTMTSDLSCVNPASASDSIQLFIDPSVTPTVSIQAVPNDTICSGDSIQFTSVVAHEGTSPVYQWHVNGILTGPNASVFTITNPTNAAVVDVTLTSNEICAVPSTVGSNAVIITVTSLSTPSVSILVTPNDTICPGAMAIFNSNIIHGGSNPAYQWQVNGISNGVNNPVFTSSNLSGGDIIRLIMISDETCLTTTTAVSNSIAIHTFPPIQLTAGDPVSVCRDETVVLHAQALGGLGGPYDYSWNNGGGHGDTITVFPSTTTNYVVSATDACITSPVMASVLVTVLPSPTALCNYLPKNPSALQPQVSFTDLSTDATGWIWNFGDGDTSTEKNPVHSFLAAGSYNGSLQVMNAAGCVDTFTFIIVVKEDVAIYIPNSFTPNNDGKNDVFSPMGSGLEKYSMTIYDRWGNEIFSGGPIHSWNGTIKGGKEQAPGGTYFYRIELNNQAFEKTVLTGGVTLIR
ncbi:MAG: gliding motility-associated C-terminal domain-containing protein [Bacteroidetes bacterium]|nr:gliding motility-associated C-terminal domain-containing protein [Bacteroidota bacterium]